MIVPTTTSCRKCATIRSVWAYSCVLCVVILPSLFVTFRLLSPPFLIKCFWLSTLRLYKPQLQYNSVFVLLVELVLIFLTIAFEEGKEHLEEKVTEDMEPIIEKLFGEMTVLGFLSIVTFLMSQFGFFEFLSIRMFGKSDEEEELLEITEIIHYGIFFIMVIFFIQVVVLIYQALAIDRLWRKLDRELRYPKTATENEEDETDPDNLLTFVFGPFIRCWRQLRFHNSFISLFPYFRSDLDELEVNRMYFRAMRDEFILERSLEPPFDPLPVSQRIDPMFNFGRYLGLCQVKFLAQIVEVDTITLLLFAVGAIAYFFFCRLVQGKTLVG